MGLPMAERAQNAADDVAVCHKEREAGDPKWTLMECDEVTGSK